MDKSITDIKDNLAQAKYHMHALRISLHDATHEDRTTFDHLKSVNETIDQLSKTINVIGNAVVEHLENNK
jgi:phosphotransferase system IIB component